MTSSTDRIIYFNHTRALSYLIERIFSGQDNVYCPGRPFKEVGQEFIKLPDVPSDKLSEAIQYLNDAAAESVDNINGYIAKADKEHKRIFMGDHPFRSIDPVKIRDYIVDGNNDFGERPLVLPDSILLDPRTTFFFTLRDPIKAVPSMWKCGSGYMGESLTPNGLRFLASFRWGREIYTYLKAHNQPAYIIDTDDYFVPSEKDPKVGVPSPMFKEFCKKIDFDTNQLVLKWDAVTGKEREEAHWLQKVFAQSLMDSETPLMSRKGKDMNIDEEKQKWVKDYGQKAADLIEKTYHEVKEDYDWMWERRLQV